MTDLNLEDVMDTSAETEVEDSKDKTRMAEEKKHAEGLVLDHEDTCEPVEEEDSDKETCPLQPASFPFAAHVQRLTTEDNQQPVEEESNSKPGPCDSSRKSMDPSLTIVLFGNSSSIQFGHENILLGEKQMNIENAEISSIFPLQRKISEHHVSVINMTGLHETDHVDHLTDQLVNENEINAFIFVVQLGQLTDADKMGLEWVQRVFGDKVLQFVTVLFTYEREESDTIIDDLKKNPVLDQLLEKCGGGYQTCKKMMNNQSEMRDLMNKIENYQQCYTREMYNTVLREREDLQNNESGEKTNSLTKSITSMSHRL